MGTTHNQQSWPALIVGRRIVSTFRNARCHGSRLAEQAINVAIRLASAISTDVVLVRAMQPAHPGAARAHEYLSQMASRLESVVGQRRVTIRVATAEPATAILDIARELDVIAIIMSTHGRSGIARALQGSTATTILERSGVPLLVLGPGALREPTTAQIRIRAPVRSLDNDNVGEVHRVVVDLEQRAVVSLVVLGWGPLGRDVLVPIEFINRIQQGEIELRLTQQELDELPDFEFNEFLTPPPTWTSFVPTTDGPTLVPAAQRKRVGPRGQDITPGSPVVALDAGLGSVDRIEVDRIEVDRTGKIEAFWVRADGIFATDMCIPAEWVERDDREHQLRVRASRADIETYLGYESRRRLTRG